MVWLAALFGNMLLQIAGSLFATVLVAGGIGVATYTGSEMAITFLKGNAVNAFLNLPASVVGMLSLMQVGSCISMVFSAMVMRMTINGITNVSKSFVKK